MKMLTGLLVGMLWFSGSAWGGDFTVNPDGSVTDNVTGLMWQQGVDNTARNWEAAITYCENLTLAGQEDWRLPNMKELGSLTDKSRFNPAIDVAAFPDANPSGYWSSTTYAYNTADAWSVSFYDGSVYGSSKTGSLYARCVRGGQ